ncbi:hypothetical protein BV20DRAFT_1056457 [Pilatotrama ljubarskyi]|nr:hypothetical protein BV20DRAFT_1056457 [Pilatotrama ljubarskyi]
MVDLAMMKILVLVAAMLAEYIACGPPNPPPKEEEMAKYSGGGLASSAALEWSIRLSEIVALHARDSRTPAASAVLSFLFKRPDAVLRLTLYKTWLPGHSSLVFGAALNTACCIALRHHFTFQLAVLKERKLVTGGPYSVEVGFKLHENAPEPPQSFQANGIRTSLAQSGDSEEVTTARRSR